MKAIEILIVGALARSVECGGGVETCKARTALWINPSLCAETTAALSKCSQTQVLSAPSYEVFEVLPEEKVTTEERDKLVHDFALPWETTNEKVQAALTQFMVWASLTRDMEMQKERDLCDSESDMPWGVQMCMDDTTSLKQIHRTQPISNYVPSILEDSTYTQYQSTMPEEKKKEERQLHSTTFGLPREKGSTLTPSSGKVRNNKPLMAPSIGESRIDLSYGVESGDIAIDAIE